MKAKFAVLLSMAAMTTVLLTGCSWLNKKTQLITITTEPEGTRLIVNGVEYHQFSPQFVEVRPSRELIVTAFKHGYKEKYYVVQYELNTFGIIDAISIIGWPGLLSDGAYTLKETNIKIVLDELPPPEDTTESTGEVEADEDGDENAEVDEDEDDVDDDADETEAKTDAAATETAPAATTEEAAAPEATTETVKDDEAAERNDTAENHDAKK